MINMGNICRIPFSFDEMSAVQNFVSKDDYLTVKVSTVGLPALAQTAKDRIAGCANIKADKKAPVSR